MVNTAQVPSNGHSERPVARAVVWLGALPVLATGVTFLLAAPVGHFVGRVIGPAYDYPLWLMYFVPAVALVGLVAYLATRTGKEIAAAVGWGIGAGLISAALTVGSFIYILATCHCLD
jgi:hypothetical protein